MGLDLADADGAVDRRADHALDVRPVVLDLRQHGIAQGEHQQGKTEIGGGGEPEQHAQHRPQPWRGWDQAKA